MGSLINCILKDTELYKEFKTVMVTMAGEAILYEGSYTLGNFYGDLRKMTDIDLRTAAVIYMDSILPEYGESESTTSAEDVESAIMHNEVAQARKIAAKTLTKQRAQFKKQGKTSPGQDVANYITNLLTAMETPKDTGTIQWQMKNAMKNVAAKLARQSTGIELTRAEGGAPVELQQNPLSVLKNAIRESTEIGFVTLDGQINSIQDVTKEINQEMALIQDKLDEKIEGLEKELKAELANESPTVETALKVKKLTTDIGELQLQSGRIDAYLQEMSSNIALITLNRTQGLAAIKEGLRQYQNGRFANANGKLSWTRLSGHINSDAELVDIVNSVLTNNEEPLEINGERIVLTPEQAELVAQSLAYEFKLTMAKNLSKEKHLNKMAEQMAESKKTSVIKKSDIHRASELYGLGAFKDNKNELALSLLKVDEVDKDLMRGVNDIMEQIWKIMEDPTVDWNAPGVQTLISQLQSELSLLLERGLDHAVVRSARTYGDLALTSILTNPFNITQNTISTAVMQPLASTLKKMVTRGSWQPKNIALWWSTLFDVILGGAQSYKYDIDFGKTALNTFDRLNFRDSDSRLKRVMKGAMQTLGIVAKTFLNGVDTATKTVLMQKEFENVYYKYLRTQKVYVEVEGVRYDQVMHPKLGRESGWIYSQKETTPDGGIKKKGDRITDIELLKKIEAAERKKGLEKSEAKWEVDEMFYGGGKEKSIEKARELYAKIGKDPKSFRLGTWVERTTGVKFGNPAIERLATDISRLNIMTMGGASKELFEVLSDTGWALAGINIGHEMSPRQIDPSAWAASMVKAGVTRIDPRKLRDRGKKTEANVATALNVAGAQRFLAFQRGAMHWVGLDIDYTGIGLISGIPFESVKKNKRTWQDFENYQHIKDMLIESEHNKNKMARAGIGLLFMAVAAGIMQSFDDDDEDKSNIISAFEAIQAHRYWKKLFYKIAPSNLLYALTYKQTGTIFNKETSRVISERTSIGADYGLTNSLSKIVRSSFDPMVQPDEAMRQFYMTYALMWALPFVGQHWRTYKILKNDEAPYEVPEWGPFATTITAQSILGKDIYNDMFGQGRMKAPAIEVVNQSIAGQEEIEKYGPREFKKRNKGLSIVELKKKFVTSTDGDDKGISNKDMVTLFMDLNQEKPKEGATKKVREAYELAQIMNAPNGFRPNSEQFDFRSKKFMYEGKIYTEVSKNSFTVDGKKAPASLKTKLIQAKAKQKISPAAFTSLGINRISTNPRDPNYIWNLIPKHLPHQRAISRYKEVDGKRYTDREGGGYNYDGKQVTDNVLIRKLNKQKPKTKKYIMLQLLVQKAVGEKMFDFMTDRPQEGAIVKLMPRAEEFATKWYAGRYTVPEGGPPPNTPKRSWTINDANEHWDKKVKHLEQIQNFFRANYDHLPE